MEKDNYFKELDKIKCDVEKKGRYNYVSWANAWKKLKEIHPKATYKVYERQEVKEGILYCTGKPYFPIGKIEGGAFVKVGVTVNEIEHIEHYPITNYQNKPIKYDEINVFDINTSIKRALAKAIAQHGIGLYVYEGEDVPNE